MKPQLGVYFTLGDLGLENSVNILKGAAAGGASLLEIGIPFSDPLLDGTVITESHERALVFLKREEKKREHLLEKICQLRAEIPEHVQISIMLCSQLLYDGFWLKALPYVDGMLVTDLQSNVKSRFDLQGKRVWFLCPTATEKKELKEPPEACSMVYFARVQGVTGERTVNLQAIELHDLKSQALRFEIKRICRSVTLPVWTGFGISTFEDVIEDCGAGAVGGIVGSKFVSDMFLNSHNLDYFYNAKQWVQLFLTKLSKK